jgi:hypothetical protein
MPPSNNILCDVCQTQHHKRTVRRHLRGEGVDPHMYFEWVKRTQSNVTQPATAPLRSRAPVFPELLRPFARDNAGSTQHRSRNISPSPPSPSHDDSLDFSGDLGGDFDINGTDQEDQALSQLPGSIRPIWRPGRQRQSESDQEEDEEEDRQIAGEDEEEGEGEGEDEDEGQGQGGSLYNPNAAFFEQESSQGRQAAVTELTAADMMNEQFQRQTVLQDLGTCF